MRGYRIELGEIEQQLLSHDKIKACAVKIIRVEKNDIIIAYVVYDVSTKQFQEFTNILKENM